ncbi:nucleotide-sugar transporter [Drechmeria coniospora]|uniref:Nucleotide-sugar transporter n=1 Tax=Drechmeria coniospora TaxID=98403 RepID=A0A151GEK4_DRECN|nr:nucleotide-sugar transporter [Drechmeria coniospora]KYK55518.1 nucleotide-sugar transporter [Drechmeria coniospora]
MTSSSSSSNPFSKSVAKPSSKPSKPSSKLSSVPPIPNLSPSASSPERLLDPRDSAIVTDAARADVPSTGVANSSAAAPSPGSRLAGSAGGDIEMEPVTGHRRRKSSIMSPPGVGPFAHRPHPHPSVSIPQDARLLQGPSSARSARSSREGSARDSSGEDDVRDDEEMGLSSHDRRRRRRKRRRNTRLDNRIAREKTVSEDERKEADMSVVKNLAITCTFILLWYIFSLSISLYNKWMFDKNNLNFQFPLFTTSLHMVIQFFLAGAVLYFIPSLRPQSGYSSDGGRSRHETEPANGPAMTKLFYLTRVGPCGVSTGLDIGLGNASLKFISLTFYTMCKSSSLAFVLVFAFLFRLEVPTWRLVAIIATMSFGVVLMVFGEIEFKLGGFVLVISAAFFSGFRWALTQILLLRNPATSNPFSSIFFLTPVMFVTLISLAVPVEGVGALWEGLKGLSQQWGPVMTPLFLVFPGCIAFCMTASEFALLQRTSVVTLSIAGIFKEVVTISAASVVFGDKLTLVNFFGLITTMAAIVAYNYVKISKMREEAVQTVHGCHVAASPASPVSHSGNDSGDEDNDSNDEMAGLLYRSSSMGQTSGSSDGSTQMNLPAGDDHKGHKSRRTD